MSGYKLYQCMECKKWTATPPNENIEFCPYCGCGMNDYYDYSDHREAETKKNENVKTNENRPMFIDLTVVEDNGNQHYVTVNTSSIMMTMNTSNKIMFNNGQKFEFTEESMRKLLDTMEGNGMIAGIGYDPYDEKNV